MYTRYRGTPPTMFQVVNKERATATHPWFFLIQPYDYPERLIGAAAEYDIRYRFERAAGSCTRPLRIIPLPLKPATMLRLTMPERGQYHGFTPFLLPTCSVGPRMALRPAACCRVSARGSDITDSDA